MRNIVLRALASAALAALALAAAPAAAKPVYMTVPRAFGTGEAPTIDLAFQRRGPVQLRVVKPEPLEPFLAGQANLRRAYVSPQTRDNPGRYLSRGLNAGPLPRHLPLPRPGRGLPPGPRAQPPLARRRDRATHGPEAGRGPGEAGRPAPRARPWSARCGSTSTWAARAATTACPASRSTSSRRGWEERKVSLEPLPAGVYLVQLVQGRVEGQVVLVVTDLRVQVKQTDGEVLVRVAGRTSRRWRGAEVQLRTPAGAGPAGKTDEQGRGAPRLRGAARSSCSSAPAQDRALVDTDFYSTLAATPDVFVYTDRPIYRPGDAVRFRGIVRQPDAFLARLFTPRSREVACPLDAGREPAGSPATARVDEFGCFSGELEGPARRRHAAWSGSPPPSTAARTAPRRGSTST